MTDYQFPDYAFNAAVMTMANKVCPLGYDVGSDAPSTIDELNFEMAHTKRIRVNQGHSDNTIFGCPEHNWAFRAWHDWTHWILQAPLDLAGELAVAHRQCEDLAWVYGNGARTRKWQRIIMAEVYGQALYYAATGKFPKDQVLFDYSYVSSGMAHANVWVRANSFPMNAG